jgi:hypothetical protein
VRKSLGVPIPILSELAKLFRDPPADLDETRFCVDESDRIVPDSNCENSTLGMSCHYVYGGTSEGGIGDLVLGGSRTPTVHAPWSHRAGFGFRRGGGG